MLRIAGLLPVKVSRNSYVPKLTPFALYSLLSVCQTLGIPPSFHKATWKAGVIYGLTYNGDTDLPFHRRCSGCAPSCVIDVVHFVEALEKVVSRQINRITVVPLHGSPRELQAVADAIKFIEGYKENAGTHPIRRYEIRIKYNNGDSIEATFRDKSDAVAFLRTYQAVPVTD